MTKPIDKEFIDKVEGMFLGATQASAPVIHHFYDGLYIRELSIAAGHYVIGHHQNFPQMNIMLKGEVSIVREDGVVTTLKAPQMFMGDVGRKIGYVHEDMVWLNVYPTNETDVDKIEEKYLTKSVEWQSKEQLRAVRLMCTNVDLLGYKLAVAECGLTEKQVYDVSVNELDMTDLPMGSYKFKKGLSMRHGTGLFATAAIASGELIALARIGGKRTVAGRFTNHSETPNAQMIAMENGDIGLYASTDLAGCIAGYDGEEILIDYREAFALSNKEVAKCQE